MSEREPNTNIDADSAEQFESTRERFHRTLVSRAEQMRTARNDVFTLPVPQFVLNFALGVATIALLVVTMFYNGTVGTVCLVVGIVLLVVTVVYNIVLRVKHPMSILQYSARHDGRVCRFLILSKTRSAFSNGARTVEVRNDAFDVYADELYPQYRFDFFADMDADTRIAQADKETYKGTIEHDGKTLKCSITFVNGVPAYGKVGGARIKYFDVNDTKEKFVVPRILRDAAQKADVDFPKLAGIVINNA